VDELVALLASDAPSDPERVTAWGKVTVAAPLAVMLAGDTVAVRVTRKLANYAPAVNDVVGLVRFGTKWVAVGAIGAA
jgi:hypothetical protein